MTEPVDTTTDPSSRAVFEYGSQGVANAATRIGSLAPSTGLDDLDDVLGKHTDKTKDQLEESKKTFDKSAKGINDIIDTDEDSAKKFNGPRATPVGFPPAAAGVPASAAAPVAPPPAPAPMSASAPSPSPLPASMRPISPQALATLLSHAGVTPESAAQAMRSGHHVGSGTEQFLANPKLARTGRGVMSPGELRTAIDRAADAAGIPAGNVVRAKWHALYRFLIEHESGNDPDRIQGVQDVNLSGGPASDGAPANAARGLCQVVPGTFSAHHVMGTSDNIYDPVANIAASMRYVMSRYHVEPKAGANFDVFESHRHAGGYTGY